MKPMERGLLSLALVRDTITRTLVKGTIQVDLALVRGLMALDLVQDTKSLATARLQYVWL